jgi:hypothetical protein
MEHFFVRYKAVKREKELFISVLVKSQPPGDNQT